LSGVLSDGGNGCGLSSTFGSGFGPLVVFDGLLILPFFRFLVLTILLWEPGPVIGCVSAIFGLNSRTETLFVASVFVADCTVVTPSETLRIEMLASIAPLVFFWFDVGFDRHDFLSRDLL
jgi:hypothetical protein